MEIKYKKNNSVLTVYVYGELDEYSAQNARGILDKLLYDNLSSKKVIFNLSGISFMDSTGIGLLIGRYKKMRENNKPIFITNPSRNAERIFKMSGLYEIIPKIV